MNWEWKSARKERGNPPFFKKKKEKNTQLLTKSQNNMQMQSVIDSCL
jgi:hypothetical protein